MAAGSRVLNDFNLYCFLAEASVYYWSWMNLKVEIYYLNYDLENLLNSISFIYETYSYNRLYTK